MQPASLIKRLASSLYEALIIIAIWLFVTFIFLLLFGDVNDEFKKQLLQVFLWVLTGMYFVLCWVKTGQTLAMQAWKIKLVNAEGECLSIKYSLLRYGLVTLSLGLFGAGFFWAFVDKDQLFLHDRLLKTHLLQLAKN